MYLNPACAPLAVTDSATCASSCDRFINDQLDQYQSQYQSQHSSDMIRPALTMTDTTVICDHPTTYYVVITSGLLVLL